MNLNYITNDPLFDWKTDIGRKKKSPFAHWALKAYSMTHLHALQISKKFLLTSEEYFESFKVKNAETKTKNKETKYIYLFSICFYLSSWHFKKKIVIILSRNDRIFFKTSHARFFCKFKCLKTIMVVERAFISSFNGIEMMSKSW